MHVYLGQFNKEVAKKMSEIFYIKKPKTMTKLRTRNTNFSATLISGKIKLKIKSDASSTSLTSSLLHKINYSEV